MGFVGYLSQILVAPLSESSRIGVVFYQFISNNKLYLMNALIFRISKDSDSKEDLNDAILILHVNNLTRIRRTRLLGWRG